MAERAEYIYRILDQYSGPLSKITSRTRKFDKQVKRTKTSLAGMQRKMKAVGAASSQMGRSMMMKTTVPIMALGIAAGKTAIDIQSGFIGVQKTVNASSEELAVMREQFKKMSTEIPVSVNELFKIGEAAGQLGIETKRITSFTKVIAMLGATTNIVGDEGAMQLARFANITGMNQKEFGRLGSTIVQLGNNLATTEAEILSMSLNLAAAGKTVGMTEHQILALAGAASSVGLEAAMGGTAFSRTMFKMMDAVDMGGSKLKRFAKVAGLSTAEFKKKFKADAAGALVQFTEGLGKLSKEGENVSIILAELGMKDVRVRDAMLRAANSGKIFSDALAMSSKEWETNNALAKEAALRFGSWGSQLTIVWNKIKLVSNELGKILVPMFIRLTNTVVPILQKFNDLSPAMKKLIVVGLALAAIIPPLLIAFGALAFSLSAILGIMAAPGFVVFASVVGGIVSAPLLAVAAAFVAIGAAIYQVTANWEALTSAGAWEDFKGWMTDEGGSNLRNMEKPRRTKEQNDMLLQSQDRIRQKRISFGDGGSSETGKVAVQDKQQRNQQKAQNVNVAGSVGISLSKELRSDRPEIPLEVGSQG